VAASDASDPRSRPLRRRDLAADPFTQFERWLADAEAAGIPLAEAMALATATPAGTPSIRMVLLKRFDRRGFVFHTGYGSRKASELEHNPHAALLFYWHELGRQVRVAGTAARLSDEESDAYFRTRPPGGRLSAWASPQSEVVESRAALEEQVEEVRRRYGDDVPRPQFWGGFVVSPSEWEFWQHRADRLHDRFRYRPRGGAWAIERLAP
jgi:pyridoxamine 5'-phosphate oxidase